MSGYRRVNYYELCRLCTSSDGTKIHIFREEGRRRQLTTKIPLCLPLQVSEDDSLPKIICSHCADKLDSFYEFRNLCVNAEAMLEGYFSSLRYSEDFLREGKVYVKDESPPKKKVDQEGEKSSLKVPSIQAVTTIPVSMEGLNNLVQAASIQIVGHPETEANKLQQYRGDMETSSAQTMVESSPVRYTYHTCTNVVPTSTTSTGTSTHNGNVTLLKNEDSTQTDMNKGDVTQSHQMDTATATYYVTRVASDVEQENSGIVNEEAEVVEAAQASELHQTITFTPTTGQDMLVHFNFPPNKDSKDPNNTATILRTDDRTSISQIGEFLRMKTVPLVVEGAHQSSVEQQNMNCDQCGKELNTPESQADHSLVCPGPMDEKGGGNFSCDVCAKPFKRKEHLFQHRKLHTGERPYACTECGKAFSRKEHLVRHSVSHTGQKVHSCDLCNKSFSRKDNLHKHRKTHGIAGPYVCEVCGKSFVVKHYYMMHKTTHGANDTPDDQLPYRCDICFKGFSVKQYLTSHKLRHRRKSPGVEQVGAEDDEVEEVVEQDPLTLSTVNAAAILPPNVMHCSTTTPLFHVSAATNTTTYLTTTTANYRRLHSS